MDCIEFKRAAGAEPQRLSVAAREHAAGCADCERYATHMLSLDGLLQRALRVPVGEVRTVDTRPVRRSARWPPLMTGPSPWRLRCQGVRSNFPTSGRSCHLRSIGMRR